MKITNTRRRIGLTVGTVALLTTLTIAGTGAANAAEVQSITPAMSVSQEVRATYGLTMRIANNTDQTMTLVSAQNPYGHWQKRAVDIPPHTTITVSNESWNANGAILHVTYRLDDGTTITMSGYDQPTVNSVDSQSSNPQLHSAVGSIDHGLHPTATFDVH